MASGTGSTPTVSTNDLAWALIDRSGEIRSRAALQDAFFLGQECGLLPPMLEYRLWPAGGTTRHNEALDEAVTELLRANRIYDTGGVASLRARCKAPEPAHAVVDRMSEVIQTCDEGWLSLAATYLMAERRERESRPQQDDSSTAAAVARRLGWPDSVLARTRETIERIRKG